MAGARTKIKIGHGFQLFEWRFVGGATGAGDPVELPYYSDKSISVHHDNASGSTEYDIEGSNYTLTEYTGGTAKWDVLTDTTETGLTEAILGTDDGTVIAEILQHTMLIRPIVNANSDNIITFRLLVGSTARG
jgi:hypothetical protein